MNTLSLQTIRTTKGSLNRAFSFRLFFLSLFFLCLLFLSFFPSSSFAQEQYKDLFNLGTNQAICKKPGVQTAKELQNYFAQNPDLIKQIMAKAGLESSTTTLFEKIRNGEFIETKITPNTSFEWMAMRKNSRVIADPKRVWRGKEAFDAFEVIVENNCNTYQLIIPKICCNLALIEVKTINETPTIDTTIKGSSLTVCSEAKNLLTLNSTNGSTTQLNLDTQGCTTINNLDPDDYTITAQAECGQARKTVTITEPPKPISIDKKTTTSTKRLQPFVSLLIGSETAMRFEESWQMDMRESTGLLSIRGGVKIPFQFEEFYIVPRIGIVKRTSINDGIDFPETSIHLDLGIEKAFSNKLFLGGGFGIWNIDDSDVREESIYLQTGVAINKKFQWFVEARGFTSDSTDDKDGLDDNHAYSTGLRIAF